MKNSEVIDLQDVSVEFLDKKYFLKDQQGNSLEFSREEIFTRVSKALVVNEKDEDKEMWQNKFAWAFEHGAVAGGRIMSNAGTEEYKPATSTINCTVSSTIPDSMDGIMRIAHEAALTLKAGCGIGYEFSTLRPKGAFVAGAGASTSGPLSFMEIFDSMCKTVSSAGGRRGAQMGTFSISHPDIEDFIKAKRKDGALRHFNLSCLITKEFMEAVKSDSSWALSFKANKHELEADPGVFELIDRDGDIHRVYKTVQAADLWKTIMESTFDFAEPGFILIDQVNEMNNNWFCENIRATNPCGEQPLPPNGSCLLGSINLTSFVRNPFTTEASFDWDLYREVIAVFTRMLDNVVEINGLALENQRDEIIRKRRHGMGYLGLGSAMTMLCMRYGSKDSVRFTELVTFELASVGCKVGLELAKEKGPAPIFEEMIDVDEVLFTKIKERGLDEILGVSVGDSVSSKDLWVNSKFMTRLLERISLEDGDSLKKDLLRYGSRFTHCGSIAPTGTIALTFGNNASNGIEPSFSHHYVRNSVNEDSGIKTKHDVFSYESLVYRALVNPNAVPFSDDPDCSLPDYFIGADQVTPKEHVDVQAAAQMWIDSSISKTINCATEIDFRDFIDVYMYAYDSGLKGCTTFRPNPDAQLGVLVKEDDLAKMTYRFRLEDGSVVEAKGNEDVEYEGKVVNVSNLYEALKEGRI